MFKKLEEAYMKAEKDFVNTMIGLIFIVLIGVAFFMLFQDQIMAIADKVYALINKQFDVVFPKVGSILPLLK